MATQPWEPSHDEPREAPEEQRSWPHEPFVGVTQHEPALHVPAHLLPQLPQLALSLDVSAQPPAQHVVPPVHVLPQLPQFCWSVCVSTQPDSQALLVPSPQCTTHLPTSQTQTPPPVSGGLPSPQTFPQAPQFRVSVITDLQEIPQSASSDGHPPESIVPPSLVGLLDPSRAAESADASSGPGMETNASPEQPTMLVKIVAMKMNRRMVFSPLGFPAFGSQKRNVRATKESRKSALTLISPCER